VQRDSPDPENATELQKQITSQNALARAPGQTQAATERLDRLFAPPGEPDEDDAADEFERILEGYDEDDDEEPTVPELLPAPREGQRETVQARALLEKAERVREKIAPQDQAELDKLMDRVR